MKSIRPNLSMEYSRGLCWLGLGFDPTILGKKDRTKSCEICLDI